MKPGKGRHSTVPLILPYCSLGLVWLEFDRRDQLILSTKLFLAVSFACLPNLKMLTGEDGSRQGRRALRRGNFGTRTRARNRIIGSEQNRLSQQLKSYETDSISETVVSDASSSTGITSSQTAKQTFMSMSLSVESNRASVLGEFTGI